MNRQLTSQELSQLNAPTMSRKEKLLRWAEIIRKHKRFLQLYNGLERYPREYLDSASFSCDGTAFAVAAADPILKEAGLTSANVGEAMRFFELSQAELHEFSCDCGGPISNIEMASAIDRIASDTVSNFRTIQFRNF